MLSSFSADERQLLIMASVFSSAFVASLVAAAVMAYLAATRKK